MLTPSLTVVDQANGTGATATVSGGDPAALNTLAVLSVPLTQGAMPWTTKGSQTGNGPFALALPPGYYWAVCTSTLGAVSVVSNLAWFAVTTYADALEGRILKAVQAHIQAMGLPGLPATQVYLKMTPDPKVVTFPAIFLTPEDTEQYQGGTNLRDDIGYPVVVYVTNRNDQNYSAKLDQYLLWRERIQRYFRFQRLGGVPEVYTCKVEPKAIIDPRLPQYAFMVSSFTLRFLAREPRGI